MKICFPKSLIAHYSSAFFSLWNEIKTSEGSYYFLSSVLRLSLRLMCPLRLEINSARASWKNMRGSLLWLNITQWLAGWLAPASHSPWAFACFLVSSVNNPCLRYWLGVPGVPWCTCFSSGNEHCSLHTVCAHVSQFPFKMTEEKKAVNCH